MKPDSDRWATAGVVITVCVAVVMVLGFAFVVFCPQCVPLSPYSPGP